MFCVTSSGWLGLIPAHAGKTAKTARFNGDSEGSSPLTRGKQVEDYQPSYVYGLIPAHAGKTVKTSTAPGGFTAHPRSRGENASDQDRPGAQAGSSPLTRGKRVGDRGSARLAGLIPAHAGKTSAALARCRARKAHPRSRGENHRPTERHTHAPGSSPLTRGKRRKNRGDYARRGLIPAHAGKTTVGRCQL